MSVGVLALQFTGSSVASAVAPSSLTTGDAHACAVVDSKAVCWGNNGSGQLGFNSGQGSSTTPVDVYTRASYDEELKDYCKGGVPIGDACIGFGAKWVYKTVNRPASPLHNKTVTKISAGQYHTCAVASARAYCWGNNGNGRLGNNSTSDSSQPVAVTTAGALRGKELVDITAGSNFSCALATDGTVACWGDNTDGQLGTGNRTGSRVPVAVATAAGSALQSNKVKSLARVNGEGTTMCVTTRNDQAVCWGMGIDDGSAIPGANSAATVCNKNSPTTRPTDGSPKEVIFSSAQPRLIPGATIATADGEAYVTGLGKDGRAYYWGQYGYREDVTYTNIRTCQVNPCTGNLVIERSDKFTISLAANGRPPSGSGGLNNNKKNNTTGQGFNGKPGMANYTRYSGNDNDNSSGCTMPRTHYGFTKNTTNTAIGQKVTATPPSWPQSQPGITQQSGNVYDGLFCAVIGGNMQCDAHGGNTKLGQLGNGKATQLSGPQAVVSNGWLAGKQISQLSTGSTGYTCAIAGDAVGCWGINTKGQLGNGSTSNKNVPTGVEL